MPKLVNTLCFDDQIRRPHTHAATSIDIKFKSSAVFACHKDLVANNEPS